MLRSKSWRFVVVVLVILAALPGQAKSETEDSNKGTFLIPVSSEWTTLTFLSFYDLDWWEVIEGDAQVYTLKSGISEIEGLGVSEGSGKILVRGSPLCCGDFGLRRYRGSPESEVIELKPYIFKVEEEMSTGLWRIAFTYPLEFEDGSASMNVVCGGPLESRGNLTLLVLGDPESGYDPGDPVQIPTKTPLSCLGWGVPVLLVGGGLVLCRYYRPRL